jgi:hypothetical protein
MDAREMKSTRRNLNDLSYQSIRLKMFFQAGDKATTTSGRGEERDREVPTGLND